MYFKNNFVSRVEKEDCNLGFNIVNKWGEEIMRLVDDYSNEGYW